MSMETNREINGVRTVITGKIEGSKNKFRRDVHEINVNINWGRIIRKLLKTKRK